MECEKKVETPLTKKQKIIYSVLLLPPLVFCFALPLRILQLFYIKDQYGQLFFCCLMMILAVGVVHFFIKWLKRSTLLNVLLSYCYFSILFLFFHFFGAYVNVGIFCGKAVILRLEMSEMTKMKCLLLDYSWYWFCYIDAVCFIFFIISCHLLFTKKSFNFCTRLGKFVWLKVWIVLVGISFTPIIGLLLFDSKYKLLLEKGW